MALRAPASPVSIKCLNIMEGALWNLFSTLFPEVLTWFDLKIIQKLLWGVSCGNCWAEGLVHLLTGETLIKLANFNTQPGEMPLTDYLRKWVMMSWVYFVAAQNKFNKVHLYSNKGQHLHNWATHSRLFVDFGVNCVFKWYFDSATTTCSAAVREQYGVLLKGGRCFRGVITRICR